MMKSSSKSSLLTPSTLHIQTAEDKIPIYLIKTKAIQTIKWNFYNPYKQKQLIQNPGLLQTLKYRFTKLIKPLRSLYYK